MCTTLQLTYTALTNTALHYTDGYGGLGRRVTNDFYCQTGTDGSLHMVDFYCQTGPGPGIAVDFILPISRFQKVQ